MITFINPQYKYLSEQLLHPEQLIARGTLIHRGRNQIYSVQIDDVNLCIKHYGMTWLKRFIYRHLRFPKGLRAIQNAISIMEAGLNTPLPIAYIQYDSLWGIQDSYYICLMEEGQTLYHWGECMYFDIRNQLTAFAQFTARLHESGLMLCDYTPGNILIRENNFTLLDTNRMRRGKVTVREGLKNMAGLWLLPRSARILAHEYAVARGEKVTKVYEDLYAEYRRDFWKRFARRHHLQDHITHRDLDGSKYTYNFETTIQ